MPPLSADHGKCRPAVPGAANFGSAKDVFPVLCFGDSHRQVAGEPPELPVGAARRPGNDDSNPRLGHGCRATGKPGDGERDHGAPADRLQIRPEVRSGGLAERLQKVHLR